MTPIKIAFTDFWPGPLEENWFYRLLAREFRLEISDDPDFLLYSTFGNKYRRYECIRIFYTGENVFLGADCSPDFFECDYAFGFDLPITERNYRLPLYRIYPHYQELKKPKDVAEISARKSGFCCFLYSQPTAERAAFLRRLLAYKKVDSGGAYLNNLGHLVARGHDHTLDFMRRYKFAVVFENSSRPGYVTEKIANAMVAGVIPIYWGDPGIARDFNPKSFINCHDYRDFGEVIEKVIEIDRDEALYRAYLAEAWLHRNRDLDYLTEESILRRFREIFQTAKRMRHPRVVPPAPALPTRLMKAVRGRIARRRLRSP